MTVGLAKLKAWLRSQEMKSLYHISQEGSSTSQIQSFLRHSFSRCRQFLTIMNAIKNSELCSTARRPWWQSWFPCLVASSIHHLTMDHHDNIISERVSSFNPMCLAEHKKVPFLDRSSLHSSTSSKKLCCFVDW